MLPALRKNKISKIKQSSVALHRGLLLPVWGPPTWGVIWMESAKRKNRPSFFKKNYKVVEK